MIVRYRKCVMIKTPLINRRPQWRLAHCKRQQRRKFQGCATERNMCRPFLLSLFSSFPFLKGMSLAIDTLWRLRKHLFSSKVNSQNHINVKRLSQCIFVYTYIMYFCFSKWNKKSLRKIGFFLHDNTAIYYSSEDEHVDWCVKGTQGTSEAESSSRSPHNLPVCILLWQWFQ